MAKHWAVPFSKKKTSLFRQKYVPLKLSHEDLLITMRFKKKIFFINVSTFSGSVLETLSVRNLNLPKKESFYSKLFIHKLSKALLSLFIKYKSTSIIIITYGWYYFISKILKRRFFRNIKLFLNYTNKPHNGPRLPSKARK